MAGAAIETWSPSVRRECSDVMPRILPNPAADRHRVIGEMRPEMLKVDLSKGENVDLKAELGGCLDYARREVNWTVDRLAAELKRDSKQVGRWIRGEERTQVDSVFAVECLRAPFVIALAKLAKCEVETTVRIRRPA